MIIKSGTVTTRKPHRCWGCRTVIPAGTSTPFTTSADCGAIATAYWCGACEIVMSDMDWRDAEDGIGYGDIADNVPEELTLARTKLASQAGRLCQAQGCARV